MHFDNKLVRIDIADTRVSVPELIIQREEPSFVIPLRVGSESDEKFRKASRDEIIGERFKALLGDGTFVESWPVVYYECRMDPSVPETANWCFWVG